MTGRIKNLCKYFGDKPIEEIGISEVQGFLNSFESSITYDTINFHKRLLGDFLDDAVEDGWINKNPVSSSRLTNPGKKGNGITAYQKEDALMLMNFIPTIADKNTALYV